MDGASDSESDVDLVPEELQVTPEEQQGSIPGSAQATAAALSTHRRAESNQLDPFRRGPPPRKKVKKTTEQPSQQPALKPHPSRTLTPFRQAFTPPGLGTAPLRYCIQFVRDPRLPSSPPPRPQAVAILPPRPVCRQCGHITCQCKPSQ